MSDPMTLGNVVDAAAQLSRRDQEQLLKMLQIFLASPRPRRRRAAVQQPSPVEPLSKDRAA